MNFDKPLVAVLIGAISTIPFEIITIIAKYLGLAKYTLYQLDSLIITGYRVTPILGFIISSIVAGFIAFVFYYAIGKIGTDYLVIKSMCISLFAWSLLEVVLTFGLEGTKIPPRPINDYYTQSVGAIVFGVSMGVLFKNYLIEKAVKVR